MAQTIAEQFELLSRLILSRAFSAGLHPAQWAALRYFAQAGTQERTATAFAAHHVTTKGTAAQTVAALVRKGLLMRMPMPDDRRRVRLDVTELGLRLMRQDPLNLLVNALDMEPRRNLDILADMLDRLAAGIDADQTPERHVPSGRDLMREIEGGQAPST